MNKLVKKSNRRNLKSTKKSNRKLNKKSNRKNLRNSKLNKKSNRKNLNKKDGGFREGRPETQNNHSYDCLCLKKEMEPTTQNVIAYANTLQNGGSRKSLRNNKTKKQSNLKKKLNRKGGDFTKKPMQFCKCGFGKRGTSLTQSNTKSDDLIIKNCKCDPITTKGQYSDKKTEIESLLTAINKIKVSAGPNPPSEQQGLPNFRRQRTARQVQVEPVASSSDSSSGYNSE